MKFSFMTFSTPNLTLQEVLDLARELNVEGIEPRTSGKVLPEVGEHKGQKHGIEVYLGKDERKAIRRQVEDSGIELACIATSVRYADPETNTGETEHTRKAIELSHDLGCRRIRVFGGPLPQSVTRDRATELLVNSLSSVAAEAETAGVLVCLETHDHWCDPNDVAAVMKQVDHPAIRVNWDFAHPFRVANMDVEESFAILRPWIAHSHVHAVSVDEDGKLQFGWIGEGPLDHKKAMELLVANDYDGYMSGEWINRDPDYHEHLPREFATLKQYRQEIFDQA